MPSVSSRKPTNHAWIGVGLIGCLMLCLVLAMGGFGGLYLHTMRWGVSAGRMQNEIVPVEPVAASAVDAAVNGAQVFSNLQQATPTGTPNPAGNTSASPGQFQPPPSDSPTATRPAASPTPTATRLMLIAFSKDQGERPEDKFIWMANSDGSDARMIIPRGSSPAFSPDGRTLAYYHWTDGIYTLQAGATQSKKILAETGAKYLAWSHDGRWIAFASREGASVDVVDPDGKNRRTIVPNASMPSWSPDDTWLAVSTCRGPDCGIFRIPSAGGELVPVVGDVASNPAVSPDGKRILYQAKALGVEQIFIVNEDGLEKKQLTAGASLHVDAQWSPDGTSIFYRSPEGNNWSIWRMNPDGSNKTRLPIDNVPPVDWPFEKLAITY